MNHELIMLREVRRVGKLAQSLSKEVTFRAEKSYATATVKDGTIGQINEICKLAQLRDECLLFCRAVLCGLKAIDKENRRLLNAYYLKRVSVGSLADSLGIPCSKVYCKLTVARSQFRRALNNLGYDEQWLRDSFIGFDFIAAHFK